MKYKNDHVRAKPYAKVEHEIKVKLKGTDLRDSPSFKVKFKVRNDFTKTGGMENLESKESHKITQYCCIGAGSMESEAKF